MSDVTQILAAIDAGDPHAPAKLLPLIYDELRRLAAAQMARESPGHTLDATGLVHEAYLRLVGDGTNRMSELGNRRFFFAAAAEAMRRILVESARRKQRIKHGGGLQRHEFDSGFAMMPEPAEDLMALDEALTRLAARYPIHARLVELRFFTGLSGDDAARLLGISPATADRHWTFARAWLRRAIDGGDRGENS